MVLQKIPIFLDWPGHVIVRFSHPHFLDSFSKRGSRVVQILITE